jgi:hypothetical protein
MAELPLSRLAPFLVLGAGRMGVFGNALGNDGDPLLYFGAGAKFGLSDLVSARFDLRDNLTQKTAASDGSLTHSLEATLGIAVRLPTEAAPTTEEKQTAPAPPKEGENTPEASPPTKSDGPASLAPDPFSPEPKATPGPEPKATPSEPKATPDANP